MPKQDLAGDLSSGLEVNPQPGTRTGTAASAVPDPGASAAPGGTGNTQQGAEGDRERDPKNYGKEAMKKIGKLENTLADVQRTNQLLVERILKSDANGTPAQPAAPQKAPYSQTELAQMLTNGESDKYMEAMTANHAWQRDQDRAEAEARMDQKIMQQDQSTRLNAYLMNEAGFGDLNDEVSQKIQDEVLSLKRQFPQLDHGVAEIVAGNKIWRSAAIGELQLPDLQEEHLRRTSAGGDATPPAAQPTPVKVDFDAPNRGLSPETVEKFEKFGLGHVLVRSQDPQSEANYRKVITDIIDGEQVVERKRRAGRYL